MTDTYELVIKMVGAELSGQERLALLRAIEEAAREAGKTPFEEVEPGWALSIFFAIRQKMGKICF